MFNNLEKITKIIKEQGKKFVDLDTSMIAIHNNFHTLAEKELALKEYIEMLEIRKDISEIKDIQLLLLDMVKTLDKYKIGALDNWQHKKRIKYMQDFIKNEVKIVDDDETIELKQLLNTEVIEPTIDKTELKETIEAIKAEKSTKK